MNTTTNYGLGKPLEEELYDLAVQNTNMDKIDTNLKSVSNTANSATSGLSTHTSNTSNPHTVTKAQIGLGNVPNVSTNNQTPSYTVPSSLSALVSGEILQTAFGKIAKAVNDLISHLANKSNPHTVTKSQVGLSNVPNVATNDQTPTYSDITSLSTLASGEKLSVAMPKIKLAITNLINHIANVSNPHSVTKSQVGLGNVDNTSDANKPISTATQTALNGKLGSTANAASASKLATARTVSLTGMVTGSGSFDGSANLSIATKASQGMYQFEAPSVIIPTNANLNSYKSVGMYCVTAAGAATTISNCPTEVLFKMIVEKVYNDNYIIQTIIDRDSQKWIRYYSVVNETWGTWSSCNMNNVKNVTMQSNGNLIVTRMDGAVATFKPTTII